MGGMVVGRVNRSTRRKHAPSATLSTRIPYGPPWDRNWLHAVRLLLLLLLLSSLSSSSSYHLHRCRRRTDSVMLFTMLPGLTWT